jgi:DNA-binding transcriptional ArsR family regulator
MIVVGVNVSSEDEVYSIIFTSLRHPVRRRILRMLADKPMNFMQMVEELGVSTSHLTYHLESLGELLSKSENNQYKLSTFGEAAIGTMRGVEESSKRKSTSRLGLTLRWKAFLVMLIIGILVSTSISALQFISLAQLLNDQQAVKAENQQLLSWGVGVNKVASILEDVAQIDVNSYEVSLLSDTLEYRSDIGAAEEILRYSLTSSESNLDGIFRFRNNHFSRYQLNPIESSPIYKQPQPSDLLESAKATLDRYKTYSGDEYLEEMGNLLAKVDTAENIELTQGNLKLKITVSGPGDGEFLLFYTEKGIDFPAKGLWIVFENHFLKELTDGYFLFNIGSTDLNITKEEAVSIAKNYAKTLTWVIDGNPITGFNTQDEPVSVELAPHPRAGSTAIIPYWYVVLRLDRVYSGGINTIAIGIYADTGEVAHVQMLAG